MLAGSPPEAPAEGIVVVVGCVEVVTDAGVVITSSTDELVNAHCVKLNELHKKKNISSALRKYNYVKRENEQVFLKMTLIVAYRLIESKAAFTEYCGNEG